MATFDSILADAESNINKLKYPSKYIKLNTKKRTDIDDVVNRNDSGRYKKTRLDISKMAYIIINGKKYSIPIEKLNKLEPNNILCNIRSKEFKTYYNSEMDTLEYIESIPDVEYIIDYIRGYDISSFDKIFHTRETNDLPRFKTILARLKLNNFLKIINTAYPFIAVGTLANSRIITQAIVNTLEPHNKLFNPELRTYPDGCEFYHNRDDEIFNSWIWPYITGSIIRAKMVKKLMEFLSSLKYNPEMKAANQYKYNKILEDIQYYGLQNLQIALLDSTNTEIRQITKPVP